MAIFFQQDIDADTSLAVWMIEEEEGFFSASVPLQREIHHPHKRLQHLAGRFLLRHLFPAFPVELIRIADTRKPFLHDEAYHFSVSHCEQYAAAIVSRNRRVGIDIEVPTSKVQRILPKFLHAKEQSLLTAPEVTSATVLWSAKEAMFKWWGLGKVEFREMLRLEGRMNHSSGSLDGSFRSATETHRFPVHYKIFDGLVLSFVATTITK